MNEKLNDALEALERGWTVEIDRPRPVSTTGQVDLEILDSGLPAGVTHYELRVYRVAKSARDSMTPPHSISAIDVTAARQLLAHGAIYVGPSRVLVRPPGPTDPSLPPVRG
jgi:hypothetical protein